LTISAANTALSTSLLDTCLGIRLGCACDARSCLVHKRESEALRAPSAPGDDEFPADTLCETTVDACFCTSRARRVLGEPGKLGVQRLGIVSVLQVEVCGGGGGSGSGSGSGDGDGGGGNRLWLVIAHFVFVVVLWHWSSRHHPCEECNRKDERREAHDGKNEDWLGDWLGVIVKQKNVERERGAAGPRSWKRRGRTWSRE